MSVRYQIVFRDGQKMERVASCFGATSYPDWSQSFTPASAARRPASEQSFIQLFTDYIHPCWIRTIEEDYEAQNRTPIRGWPNPHDPAQTERDKAKAVENFMAEAKLLLDDIPHLKKVITVHPILQVVRGHFKDTRADQVILSMFCMRNLMSYSQMAYTYRKLRKDGYRPRVAAVVAHQVSLDFNAMGQPSYNDQRCGETNWINPETFGRNAWLRFMNQDIDSEFDFNQEPWRVQCGYRRDNTYQQSGNIFDRNRAGGTISNWVTMEVSNDSWSRDRQRHRKLVDGYSIVGDSPLSPSSQHYHTSVGYYIVNASRYVGSDSGTRIPSNNGQEAFDHYMDELSTYLRENGINPMSE